MKKIITIVLSILLCLGVVACGGSQPVDDNKPIVIPEGYEKITVKEKANKYAFDGMGAQMDQCIVSGGYLMNAVADPNVTDADLKIWDDRLSYMKIDLTRIAVIPEWWEPANDNADPNQFDVDSPNLTWESPKMKVLYQILDLCKKHNIKVNFSLYGIYPSSWNAALNPSYPAGWLTSPESNAEFAESLYGALHYLTTVKDYGSIINEFSIYPEPNTSYVQNGGYEALVRACDEKLKKEKVRDQFLFSGPAEVSDYNVYEKVVTTLGDVFDKLTGSFYKFNNKTNNFEMIAGMEPFAKLADTVGATYGVSEFGSNLMITAAEQVDIDTYDRALYLARFATNALAQGFTNMSYWVLGDCMYDGTLMQLGLWKYKNYDWAFRPQFYSYSLMTRYTEPNSKIFATDVSEWDTLSMVAMQTTEGKWTYIIVNNSMTQRKISIVNSQFKTGELSKFELSENSLPDGTMEIGMSRKHTINNQVLSLALKSASVTILTELA